MLQFKLTSELKGQLLVAGAPVGHDARVVLELLQRGGHPGVVHVATDDARMATMRSTLEFFAPDVELASLPAWDCLPYDRASPKADVVARRVDALTELAARPSSARPRIVLTTVNAILQRLPPRAAFADTTFRARAGERLDQEALQSFLIRNGYTRAQTVREPGEYALRGGIVDLFPPGTDEPARLDLFGDELEGIRTFDPMSQRTVGRISEVALKPMGEATLDQASIARFRSGYRELFGAVNDGDPLYESISAGRRQAGWEHWLPLFHERMETLFDYLPTSLLVLDHQVDGICRQRQEQIADFYEARRTMQSVERKTDGAVYKPLSPDRLYLTAAEWEDAIAVRPVAALSPFQLAGQGIDAQGRRGRDFADARSHPDANVFDAVRDHLAEQRREGRRVVVAAYTAGARDRLRSLLVEHGVGGIEVADGWRAVEALDPRLAAAVVLPVEHGFTSPDLAVVTETDILGDRLVRPVRRRRASDQFISEVSSLATGDLVVHVDHGIGRYAGLETLTVGGAPHDCLKILYAGDDKLFVPVENIEVLSRFGSEDTGVQLDRLGGAGWQARKARVGKKLKDMAAELMRIAAARSLKHTEPMPPPEGAWDEFAARFPFSETEDQLRAIADVVDDLAAGRPMDRLICGDVGFGKTEVAMRAAFIAAMAGFQVAVVVPTTLLARQHMKTFTERFVGLPIRIAPLSRLVPAREQRDTRDGLRDGTVDVVVGTHAVLSKSVSFKRLGLVIVDEEQHFGVKQKERLKALREDVHVLTLSATPIPRTLQLALSGVRELSLIATPPVDRLAVRTFVLPYDPVVVREAILREHFRGGQTYYVCPRIEDLERVRLRLQEIVPEIKVTVAHGRMAPSELEDIMSAYYDGRFDVLLSTSIVESGLDVPSANTLIIHRADMFGLAQLYQLRGRIGRSKLRGYAYLTYAPNAVLSEISRQRLHIIETLDTLGAGFTLASHDMDIRGAGNLLGEEQSGHIREVGVELYQQMLREAVELARTGAAEAVVAESWSPQINIGLPVLIPETYVADLHVRLDLYRRASALADREEIDAFAAELIDRFGPLPAEVENLLNLVAIKRLCRDAGVEKFDAGPKGAVVAFRGNLHPHPDRLVDFIARQAGSVKLRPDHRLVVVRGWDDERERLDGAKSLVRALADLARAA